MLTASIGKPEHPGRLRGKSLGYTKVKDVYGKSRRRSGSAQRDERIRQLEETVQTQSALLTKVLEILPAELQQHFGYTPARPSAYPTQESSNQFGGPQLPVVDEVTIPFMFFKFRYILFIYLCVTC